MRDTYCGTVVLHHFDTRGISRNCRSDHLKLTTNPFFVGPSRCNDKVVDAYILEGCIYFHKELIDMIIVESRNLRTVPQMTLKSEAQRANFEANAHPSCIRMNKNKNKSKNRIRRRDKFKKISVVCDEWCYDDTSVVILGNTIRVKAVVNYLKSQKVLPLGVVFIDYKFVLRREPLERVPDKVCDVLRKTSSVWRSNFVASLNRRVGKNVSIRSEHESRFVEKIHDPIISVLEAQCRLCVSEAKSFDSFGFGLDMASIGCSQILPLVVDEAKDFFVSTAFVLEMLKSIRNAKTGTSVIASVMCLAAHFGVTVESFMERSGMAMSGSKIRFRKPRVEPKFSMPPVQEEPAVELVEETTPEDTTNGSTNSSFRSDDVEVAPGIWMSAEDAASFVNPGGVEAQVKPESFLFKIAAAVFSVGLALSFKKMFSFGVEPYALLGLTRNAMLETSDSFIETIMACLKSLKDYNFWDAVSIFKDGFLGKDVDEIIAIGKEVEALSSVKVSASKALAILNVRKNRVTTIKAHCSSIGRSHVEKLCIDLVKQIDDIISNKRQVLELSGIKPQPLLFVGVGVPGSGKSLLSQCIIAALGSLYELDDDVRRQVTYYPSSGSAYYEGFNSSHMHIHKDEIGSINMDLDKNAASEFHMLLDTVTSVPTSLNMAFGDKGKMNTSNVRVVSCNTNSDIPSFAKMFSNNTALFRRAYFVRFVPHGKAGKSGVLDPLKLKDFDVSALDDSLVVEVFKVFKDANNQNLSKEIVSVGPLSGFAQFVYSELKNIQSGKKMEVARMFSQVASMKISDTGIVLPKKECPVLFSGGLEPQGLFSSCKNCTGKVVKTAAIAAAVTTGVTAVVESILVYEEFRNFYFKHWKKILLLSITILGTVSYFSGSDEPCDAQALSMPKPLPFGEDADGEIREWHGKLFKTNKPVENTGISTPLFGGGKVTVTELAKVERNCIILSMSARVNGVWGGQTIVHGYCFSGYVLTVAHILPKGADLIRVVMKSARFNRANDAMEFKMSEVCVMSDYDLMLIPSTFPSGVKDLKKQMKFGIPKKGDKCYLLGAGSRPRLEGTVLSVGPFESASTAGNLKYKTAIETCIVDTQDGDCGRLLVTEGSNGLSLSGTHSSRNKNLGVGYATYISEEELYQKILTLRGVDAQCLMSSDDIELGAMLHPELVVDGVPRHGLFADPFFKDKSMLPIMGLEKNARGGKSSLKKSLFFEEVDPILRSEGHEYAPAVLRNTFRWDSDLNLNRNVSPYEYGMSFGKNHVGIPQRRALEDCLNGAVEAVAPLLVQCGISTLDESLNGIGIMGPVNPSTGAGMYMSGKKGEFIWETAVDGESVRYSGQELREEVNNLFSRLVGGCVPPGVSKVTLKDELLKVSKIEGVKTRMIHVVEFAEYLLGRMLMGKALSTIYSALQRVFGMCFVVNSHGPDWKIIFERSVKLTGGFLNLFSDFVAYDLHHLYTFLFYAMELLARLMEIVLKVPKKILNCVVCLLWMKLYRVSRVDGVWVFAFLGGPSGDLLTIYFNCACQLFYWYVTWYNLRPTNGKFVDFMSELGSHWNSLGDDCSMRVPRPVSQWFLPSAIIEVMSFRCGQEITSGMKNMPLSYGGETEFLKRRFREVGDRVFAPLNKYSCLKMLLYFQEDSTKGDIEFRNWQLLDTVWSESFFHDVVLKTELRELVSRLKNLLTTKYKDKPFRTDEELLFMYDNSSLGLWNNSVRGSELEAQSSRALNENWASYDAQPGAVQRSVGLTLREADWESMIKVQEKDGVLKSVCLVDSKGATSYDVVTLFERRNLRPWSVEGGILRPAEKHDNNDAGVRAPIEKGSVGLVVTTSADDEKQGTATADSTFPKTLVTTNAGTHPFFNLGEPAMDHDEYFDRPIVIGSFTWTSAVTQQSMNPFTLWFNTAVITNRFQCWSNVRFDLKLRFEFSPSFFHNGLVRIWWYPLYQMIGDTSGFATPVSQLSAAKGFQNLGVFIDAAQPGVRELVIPWKHFRPAVDVTVASAGLNTIGLLVFSPVTALSTSNSLTVPDIVINVRAHGVNVQRFGPTRNFVQAQSAISKGFGKMGEAFKSFGTIPMLAPAAKAAEAVSKGISSFADVMGWSRQIKDTTMRMARRSFGFAQNDEDDGTLSLSYSKAYSLTADTSLASGVKEDEMSFLYIAKHWSLIGIIAMVPNDTFDTLLGTIHVHPMISYPEGSTAITPCAVGYVAAPFSYWRGSLEYEFRVVCSNQHAGQIRIVYDGNNSAVGATLKDTARVCVLEIKPGASAKVVIGHSRPYSWNKTRSYFRGIVADSGLSEPANGILRVHVFTPLLSPLTTQGISIVVSVRACDDFRVHSNKILPNVRTSGALSMMGAPEEPGEDVLEAQSALINNIAADRMCHFGSEPIDDNVLYSHSMGEPILSVRSLLKRFHYLGEFASTAAGTNGANNKVFGTGGPIHETAICGITTLDGGTVNYVGLAIHTPFRWFKSMYAGHRGGARYRVRTNENVLGGTTLVKPVYSVALFESAVTEAISNSEDVCASPYYAWEVSDEWKDESGDFRLPDYNMWMYTPGGFYVPPAGEGFARFVLRVTRAVNDALGYSYGLAKSIDEDFSFVNFIGSPVVTYVVAPP